MHSWITWAAWAASLRKASVWFWSRVIWFSLTSLVGEVQGELAICVVYATCQVEKLSLGYGGDFRFVLPFLLEYAFAFVVPRELVDFGFDKLHVAFVVAVFAVFFHVDCHALGFFHEVVEVFRHGWSEVCSFEGVGYAFASYGFSEGYGVLVSEDSAYAAGGVSFFGEFDDEGFYFFWFVFAPVGWSSADWACCV